MRDGVPIPGLKIYNRMVGAALIIAIRRIRNDFPQHLDTTLLNDHLAVCQPAPNTKEDHPKKNNKNWPSQEGLNNSFHEGHKFIIHETLSVISGSTHLAVPPKKP